MNNPINYYDAVIAAVKARKPRAFMGANGLWYAAEEDENGFHTQGIGVHSTAQKALDTAARAREEYLKTLEAERAQYA